jgi:hypothetical protein
MMTQYSVEGTRTFVRKQYNKYRRLAKLLSNNDFAEFVASYSFLASIFMDTIDIDVVLLQYRRENLDRLSVADLRKIAAALGVRDYNTKEKNRLVGEIYDKRKSIGE